MSEPELLPQKSEIRLDEEAELAVAIGSFLLLTSSEQMSPFGRIRVVERSAAAEVVWEPEEQ